jgi:hypothetical protein
VNDNDVMDRVSQSLSGVHMHTPVEEIMARARARRRRRVSGVAGAGAAAGVAVTVALLAVTGSGGSPSTTGSATPQLVAFTVVSGPNGSSDLTLRKGAQYRLDADALRQALAQHNIPAVVNVGKMCDTHPEPDGLDQVISSRRLPDGSVFTTFNPAAMPAGSEISIGYFPTSTDFALIEAGAPLHCSANPNPGSQPAGSGAGPHAQRVPGGQNTNG